MPGARHGMYLYTSSLEPAVAPRLMERVLGSLFVLTPGRGHADQLGWRLIVPFPLQLHPIVPAPKNKRHLSDSYKISRPKRCKPIKRPKFVGVGIAHP